MGTSSLLIKEPILFFDSSCVLCNKSVQLLLDIDRKQTLKFASLQSGIGKSLLEEFKILDDSVVLLWKGKAYIKSEAVLQLSKILGFPYKIFLVFYIIPKGIRNWVYDVIAQNRKHWFGVTNQCYINQEQFVKRIIP